MLHEGSQQCLRLQFFVKEGIDFNWPVGKFRWTLELVQLMVFNKDVQGCVQLYILGGNAVSGAAAWLENLFLLFIFSFSIYSEWRHSRQSSVNEVTHNNGSLRLVKRRGRYLRHRKMEDHQEILQAEDKKSAVKEENEDSMRIQDDTQSAFGDPAAKDKHIE